MIFLSVKTKYKIESKRNIIIKENENFMNYWRKEIIGFFFIIHSTTILAESEQLDKIIAIVNDDIILNSSIENLINIEKIRNKNIKKQIINENILRSQILERLITDKIILQIAEKMQIEIPDQTIDFNITNIAKQNGLTFNQLQKRLSMIGINFKNYRNDIHREIIISEVINNEVRRQIIILPQEVNSLVTQLNSQIKKDSNINLSHILIPLSKNPTNKENKSAIDEIKKIFLKLNQGADFTKLSITYSINKNTLKNRKISWSKIEELPNIFAQRIQYAKKGDIIGPIRSSIGFHILKINDIQNTNIPLPIFVIEVKARHILIKLSPIINNREANKKIKQIAKQIEIGEITFSNAAKKYSQDPYSAFSGGKLDWNIPNFYDPAFRDGLMTLSKGEISKPIRSSLGWHLIKLEDIRQVDKTDVVYKDRAYRILYDRKFKEEARIWLQKQRAFAYVKIFN